jgi:hypothetical protein
MKYWVKSLIITLFALNQTQSVATYRFNPKIERKSLYDCGWCNNQEGGYCGTMGGCKTKYIYHYPKNIDKMIKENPEFKDEIGDDFDFNITILPQECRNKIRGSIYNVKDGFKEQLKILKECNAEDANYQSCTNSVIESYIHATEDQIKELEQKLLLPDNILIQDEFCKEEPLNPKKESPRTCYQLWKYDSCGYCSTVDIKSYYNMQIECDKVARKVLRKTGKFY